MQQESSMGKVICAKQAPLPCLTAMAVELQQMGWKFPPWDQRHLFIRLPCQHRGSCAKGRHHGHLILAAVLVSSAGCISSLSCKDCFSTTARVCKLGKYFLLKVVSAHLSEPESQAVKEHLRVGAVSPAFKWALLVAIFLQGR